MKPQPRRDEQNVPWCRHWYERYELCPVKCDYFVCIPAVLAAEAERVALKSRMEDIRDQVDLLDAHLEKGGDAEKVLEKIEWLARESDGPH